MFARYRVSFGIRAALRPQGLRHFSASSRTGIRLINVNTMQMKEFFSGATPKYAILSHTWGSAEEEVSYADYVSKVKQNTAGHRKILACANMAKQFKLNWAWIDTCCIDKSSSAELSEAINSMYLWYQNSHVCFALLTDLRNDGSRPLSMNSKLPSKKATLHRRKSSTRSFKVRRPSNALHRRPSASRAQSRKFRHRRLSRKHTAHFSPIVQDCNQSIVSGIHDGPENVKTSTSHVDNTSQKYSSLEEYEKSLVDPSKSLTLLPRLQQCRWFTRGWTLQELLAPPLVIFYDNKFQIVGTRGSLAASISSITGIQQNFLEKWQAWRGAGVAQRMSWLSCRSTSRDEDMSYCMLGLFDVNMPLLYGEGGKAFDRLQEQIILNSSDESIFAWTSDHESPRGLLAEHPKEFSRCGDIVVTNEAEESKTEVTSRGIELARGPKNNLERVIWSLGIMPVPTVWHRLTYVLACEDTKKERAVTIKLSMCREYRNYPFHAPVYHLGRVTWYRVQYKFPHYRRKSPDNLMARTAPLLSTKLLVAKHTKSIRDAYIWSDFTWAKVPGRMSNVREHSRGLDSNLDGFTMLFAWAIFFVGSFYYAPTTKHRKDKFLVLLLTPIIGPLLGITHPAVPLIYLSWWWSY